MVFRSEHAVLERRGGARGAGPVDPVVGLPSNQFDAYGISPGTRTQGTPGGGHTAGVLRVAFSPDGKLSDAGRFRPVTP